MARRPRPVPAADAHFDAGAPRRGDGDRELDEIPMVIITNTEDKPGGVERVVEALARLLATRPGER